MTRSSAALALFVAVALPGTAFLTAQTSPRPATPSPAATRATSPSSTASARANAAASAKGTLPDPVLFDGSKEQPEKRPDRGMLAEFELPGSEQKSDRVGGPAGGGGGGQNGELQGAGGPQGTGAARQQSANAAGRSAVQDDPNATAEGASAENLNIPEGAQADQSAAQAKPRDVSLGDASMQIQTATNQQNAVGGQQQQASNAQQYEKGAAQGNQKGDNTNRGVERGQAVPSGL